MNQESKTAVIYARYSSDKQNEQSIEGQISVIEAFAKREGYDVIDTYIDRAMTGRSDDRPSFQNMIEDSKNHLFHYVIVYKLDRFSRNRYHSAIYKKALQDNGVKVISATENIGDNPEGAMLESILEGYSEYYSKELAQKVRRGNKESRKKGLFTGGTVPYGYVIKDKKYRINKKEAKIVREIFDKSLSGMRMKDIADELNARLIPYKKDGKWDINRIKRLLSNEKYIGIAKFGDDSYDNIVPPIIDKDVFEKIRKQCLKRKHGCKRKDEANEYILTGRLFCAKCGSSIVGHSGRRRNESELYHYYVCNGRMARKCDLSNARKEDLEDEVASIVFEYISKSDIDELTKKMAGFYDVDDIKTEASILKSKIAEIDRQLINCMKAIRNGFYSETMNRQVSELEEEKKNIEERIKNLKSKEKPIVTASDVKRFISTAKDSTYEYSKESILRYFVKSVYIDEEYIKINIYPSDNPILRSRKDTFEIANENERSGDGKKIQSLGDDSDEHPCLARPPNVSRTPYLSRMQSTNATYPCVVI